MKTAVGFMMAAWLWHAAVVAFPLADPGRLLRVPRIYNALISSDAKLQPSRAFPYSTPVYQPLPGPVFDQWQPPAYDLGPIENTGPEEQGLMKMETSPPAPKENEENAKSKSENAKTSAPLTFYPRSFGYYQPQPILPYGYPFGPQPYAYGSPFDFGHQPLYRYPTPSFDGYYGGGEQFGSGYHPGNIAPEPLPQHPGNMAPEQTPVAKKSDDVIPEKESNKSTSDSVGVRESEFLADEEEDEQSPEVKGSDTVETS